MPDQHQWRWTVVGRDDLHRGTFPRAYEDEGIVDAEHVGEAFVRVVNHEIEWGMADDAPVTITLTPILSVEAPDA